MSNIFNLIENFVDILNNKYSLVTGAKYYNSNMNDAYTKSLYDIVGHPTKVIWPTVFFSQKESDFCMAFVSAVSWPTWASAHKVCLKYNI